MRTTHKGEWVNKYLRQQLIEAVLNEFGYKPKTDREQEVYNRAKYSKPNHGGKIGAAGGAGFALGTLQKANSTTAGKLVATGVMAGVGSSVGRSIGNTVGGIRGRMAVRKFRKEQKKLGK